MISVDTFISQYFFEFGRTLPLWLVSFLATHLIWLMALAVVAMAFSAGRRLRLERILGPALGALLALGANSIVEWIYFRPRPFVAQGFESLVLMSPLNSSFPSGHAAVSWALAAVVFSWNKKIGALFGAAALLVSFGRLLAGVHYALDIFAGALVGLTAGFFISWYSLRTKERPWRRWLPF